MIGRDYFKRQAKTLRKMGRVAQDPVIADRLCEMADEFDLRADGGRDDSVRSMERSARGDEGHS